MFELVNAWIKHCVVKCAMNLTTNIITIVQNPKSHESKERRNSLQFSSLYFTSPSPYLVQPAATRNTVHDELNPYVDLDVEEIKRERESDPYKILNFPFDCRVRIPVPIGYEDVLDIESWPLLQAFCPTGFFTSMYTVVDINVQLDIIFKSIDAYSIESVLTSSKSIYIHTTEMLNTMNVKGNFSRTQLSVEEILMPYYSLYDLREMGTAR